VGVQRGNDYGWKYSICAVNQVGIIFSLNTIGVETHKRPKNESKYDSILATTHMLCLWFLGRSRPHHELNEKGRAKMNKKYWLKTYSLLAILVLASFVVACGDDDDDDDGPVGYTDVSAMEARALIDENEDLVIIDVSPYFDDGHVPGALNYPISSGAFDEILPSLDSEDMYLIYCHGDSPSISASEKLVDAGFEMVYRLEGNYQAWVDAGYDIEY
jgi:rhodanese-related sulfurtransferase